MFANEQMTDLQNRLNHAVQTAQAKASARAKEFEQEARKVLETLGDRAQAELKVLFAHARELSREQVGVLGVELEKLGKRLQEVATEPVAAPGTPEEEPKADVPPKSEIV